MWNWDPLASHEKPERTWRQDDPFLRRARFLLDPLGERLEPRLAAHLEKDPGLAIGEASIRELRTLRVGVLAATQEEHVVREIDLRIFLCRWCLGKTRSGGTG